MDLDTAGLPEPVATETIRKLANCLHDAYHEEKIVCVVCDQICRISKTQTLDVPELPTSFFKVLLKPTGKDGEAPVLNEKLVSQYDITKSFPEDQRFKNLLLSPRGLKMHLNDCEQKSSSCCVPQLHVCLASGCLQAPRRGKTPNLP